MQSDNSVTELPLELIRDILLRLPIKPLVRFKCVSKVWLSLISDPNFAETHFELSAARTHRCLFTINNEARIYDLDAVFRDDPPVEVLSLPQKSNHRKVKVLASCRGFVLLQQDPYFIIWNPTTGCHRQIVYSRILSNAANALGVGPNPNHLIGFGYDRSKDDYLLVLGIMNDNNEGHFYVFSLRANSWKKNLEVAFPKSLGKRQWSPGSYLNGAIHWLGNPCNANDHILVFDLVERRLSEIHRPQPLVAYRACHLTVVGGCLILCGWAWNRFLSEYEMWVMKEYKVQSSWTLSEICAPNFKPLCLSNGGDFIGLDFKTGFVKYNIRGELLKRCKHCAHLLTFKCAAYTESLLPIPSDLEEKKKGRQLRERKRIRSAPA